MHRKLLVAVSGLSPQIITETLYALYHQQTPWIPEQIYLITTSKGKQLARLQLIEGQQHLKKLQQHYPALKAVNFNEDNIHVLTNAKGNPLPDLKSLEDNEAAADCISEHIRTLTADEETELHVSLAGGRKTMGFYIGYALSIYGRPQDTLSHVLVSPEYESIRDFFYPTPTTHVIYKQTLDGNSMPLDAADAIVTLANIPFVRLRGFLSDESKFTSTRFSELVSLLAAATNPLSMQIDYAQKTITANGIPCRLPPSQLAFYLWILKQQNPISPLVNGEYNTDYRHQFIQHLIDIEGISKTTDQIEHETLKRGMDKQYFDSTLSKLKRNLKRTFGPELSNKITVIKEKREQKSYYIIPIAEHQIDSGDIN